jgi:hypothetical protein
MEATTKRIVQRNLPLTSTYELVWIKNGSLEHGDTWQCENCNAGIVNMACIKNEDGKTNIVGLDCMKTLTLKPTTQSAEMLEDYKAFTAFIGRCNKPDAQIEIEGSRAFLKIPKSGGFGKNHYSEALYIIEQFMGLERFKERYL